MSSSSRQVAIILFSFLLAAGALSIPSISFAQSPAPPSIFSEILSWFERLIPSSQTASVAVSQPMSAPASNTSAAPAVTPTPRIHSHSPGITAAAQPRSVTATAIVQQAPPSNNAVSPSALSGILASLANLIRLIPTSTPSPTSTPTGGGYSSNANPPLGGGSSNTIAAGNAIDQLTNTTITGGSITNTSFAGGPISATSLAVSGAATLSGNLNVLGNFTAGTISFGGASSSNSISTNATTTNLFASIANFTSAIANTLSASVANITGLTATNATTTNLAITGAQSGFLETNASGIVSATSSINAANIFGLLTTNVAEGSNLYFTPARVAAVIAATTTDALAEGLTNKYFTNARAQGAISVSGSPLTYSGGVIGISQANGSTNGFLSSADWTNFNAKLATSSLTGLITTADLASTKISQFSNDAGYLTSVAGAASSTLLSDNNSFSGNDSFTSASSNFAGTWQTFSPSHFQTALGFTPYNATNPNGYIALTALSAAYPLAYNSTTGVVSSATSSATSAGILSAADWTTFNSKQPAGAYLTANQPITLSGAVSGTGATSIIAQFASTTPVAFGGTGATAFTGGQLLAYNGTSFVSTSTIGNNQLQFSNITVNGTNIGLGGSATISAASSTLLANSNTFSGSNIFTGNTTLANATSTSFFAQSASLGSLSLLSALGIGSGGTGANSFGYGLVLGNGANPLATIATSSLGLLTTNVAEGSNLYFTPARVAAVIAATTTDALAEGLTNKYFTNARADARINATSSIGTLAAAPSLSSVNTSLTGILRAASGILSTGAIGLGTADVSGVLSVADGGTGWANLQGNTVLLGNGSGAIATTTRGNLTETGSSILTITGGTGALLGSGATIQVAQASGSQSGFLSSSDWSTFNGKQAALAFSYPLINAGNTISFGFGTTTANTWSGLQTFAGGFLSQASSTVNGSFTATGPAVLGSTLNVTGNSIFTNASSTNFSASGEGFFATASTTNLILGTGPGFLQTNAAGAVSATSTFALSSTFGILGIGQGGTGTSTAPGSNQLLIGNGSGGYNYVSTSSLGLLSGTSLSGASVISYSSGSSVITTAPGTFGGSGTYAFPNNITVGLGTSTFAGNIGISGNIVPSADNTYSLGLPTNQWKDVYIGPGSLYVNGQEVVHTDVGDDVVVTADSNENLILKSAGSGSLQLNSSGTGNIQLAGPVQITGGKNLTTSDGSSLSVPFGVAAGNITLSGNTIQAINTNGGISISPAGNGGSYFTNGNVGVGTTNPGSKLEVQGTVAAQNFSATSTTATSTFADGINLTGGCFAVSGACLNSIGLGANTWTGLQTFSGGASTTNFTASGVGYFGAVSTANLTATTGTTTAFAVTGVASSLLKTNALGQVAAAVAGTDYATTTTGMSLLYGNNVGGFANASVSSASGISFAAGMLSLSSIPNSSLANSSITVNGNTIALGGSGTITAASSTLLSDNNTFSGSNIFSNIITGSVSGNAGSVTNGVYTTTFNGIFDPRFVADLAATSSINSLASLSNLAAVGALTAGSISSGFGNINIGSNTFTGLATGLSGTANSLNIGGNAGTATKLATARTINGVSFDGSANIVVASTTLLSDNNTFSGNTILANATSTNFFATTASSTNLFAQTAGVGTLNLANALAVSSGGTGASLFGQGWIYSSGGAQALAASTSPTVNYITATSTTATSTVAGGFAAGGTGLVYNWASGWTGIGTASPSRLLNVFGTAANPQERLSYNSAAYTDMQTDAAGDYLIAPTSGIVEVANGNIEVCSNSVCATPTVAISGNGNLTVDNRLVAGSIEEACPSGYIWVPGESKYGTLPGFCTMKYDASNDGSGNAVSVPAGTPWVSISQTSAIAQCQALGPGYHLINENEWMTIASEIAALPINDIDAAAGLQLATGHSDNNPANALSAGDAGTDPVVSGCNWMKPLSDASNAFVSGVCEERGNGSGGSTDADKGYYGTGNQWSASGYAAGGSNKSQLRTFVLPDGAVIWDMAGNVNQWTDATIWSASGGGAASSTVSEMPDAGTWTTSNWYQYTAITNYKSLGYARPDITSWSSGNGIGQIYLPADTTGQYRGFIRGGFWSYGSLDGVFTLGLNNAPSGTSANIGFRCSR